ncbi:hypothetical protein ES705_51167 [subsurface metagenome]
MVAVVLERILPNIATTFSLLISLSAAVMATFGSPSESAKITSIFAPPKDLIPPLALISSIASKIACLSPIPIGAKGPDSG